MADERRDKRPTNKISEAIKKAKLDPRNKFDNETKEAFLKANSPTKKTGIFKYANTEDRTLRLDAPGDKFEDGLFSFGLRSRDIMASDFTKTKALGNLAVSLNPMNTSAATDMLNGLGLLTKTQKYQERMNKSMFRGMNSGMNLMFAGSSIDEGVDPISSAIQFGASNAVIFGGLRVGEAVGGLASTFIKNNTGKRLALNAGRIGGFVGGIATVALSGLGDTISTIASSTNEFAKKANDMFHGSQYASGFQSQETLTARQAALSKLSKAGINDRALILGNEALMYRSVM